MAKIIINDDKLSTDLKSGSIVEDIETGETYIVGYVETGYMLINLNSGNRYNEPIESLQDFIDFVNNVPLGCFILPQKGYQITLEQE